ncbi:MAG TPA: hypothetical protein VK203_19245 [Nostocaceae cyanobacterium]|nr:hypothetical protein [Nostocaceae cyanobacterium]
MMPTNEPDLFKIAKNFVKGIVKDQVYGIMDTLRTQEVLTELEPASTQKILSYCQVLEYAADKKLKYSNISSTLLKLDSSPEGWVIFQVFIDEKGEILPKGRGYLGRKVTVQEFDEELKDILDGKESVVIDLP